MTTPTISSEHNTLPFHGLLRLLLALLVPLANATAAGNGDSGAAIRPIANEMEVGVAFLPGSLRPFTQIGHTAFLLNAQIFASPLRFDADNRPAPYLAERWSVADDERSVTLHLVADARFHDGAPVTSDDVAFSLLALRDRHPWRDVYAPIAGVETPDPLTAVIRLKHPHPALAEMLSPRFCPILPRKHYGESGDRAKGDGERLPVGSGPFRVVNMDLPQRIELARFDGFFRPGLPRLDRIGFRSLDAAQDPILQLTHGRVHLHSLLYEGQPGFQELRRNPTITLRNRESSLINPSVSLALNLKRKPLDDPRVRQAMAMAIDRERAVKVISAGRDAPRPLPIARQSPLFTDIPNPYPFDTERANALLDEAGYPRDEKGTRFSVTLDAIPADESVLAAADYYAYELQRLLGIEVIPHRSLSVSEWLGRLIKGDYQLNYWVLFDWNDPLFSIHRVFRSAPEGGSRYPFTNNMGYSNPQMDEWLDQAGAAIDPRQRRALYANIQRQLLQDLPVIGLTGFDLFSAHHRDLLGFDGNAWGVLAPYDEIHWRGDGE